MNCTARYSFCRSTPTRQRSTTTFVKDETAAKFGFIIERNSDGENEKFLLKRNTTVIEFDRLDQLQCWLKGYEFSVVNASEYH